MRSTVRLYGVEKRTVLSVLKLAGEKCGRLLAERVRNVPVGQVQMDEIWTFGWKNEAHEFPFEAGNDKIGDAYTFVALERNKKLVLAWHLGKARPREHRRLHFEGEGGDSAGPP